MIYFISLAIVSIIFINHMMKFDFLIIGIAWVLLFFLLSVRYTRKWADILEKNYIRKLFFTALTFRIVWVLFSYIYYFIRFCYIRVPHFCKRFIDSRTFFTHFF